MNLVKLFSMQKELDDHTVIKIQSTITGRRVGINYETDKG